MRALLASVVGAAMMLVSSVAEAPATYRLEAQSWWNGPVGGGEPDKVAFPFRHIHFAVSLPLRQTVSGIVEVPWTAFDHGNVGTLTQVKWQDDQGGSAQTIVQKVNFTGEAISGVFRIDTRNERDGLRLWRFYAYWQHPNGNLQVARPIYSVDVENGKDDVNKTATLRPTGWYKETTLDWGYVQASMPLNQYPLGPITSVWKPTVKCAVNGNVPISKGSVHLDPDFHNGDIGDVLAIRAGAGTMTPVINPDELAAGEHRLVVRCEQDRDGKHHEGVGVYPFTVN